MNQFDAVRHTYKTELLRIIEIYARELLITELRDGFEEALSEHISNINKLWEKTKEQAA